MDTLRLSRIASGFVVPLLMLLATVPLVGAEPIDFTRDIRSILSNKCFHCHGPDEAERQGGVRLDTRDGAHGTGDSGLNVISPGDVDDSELFRRITSTDPSEQMPPPGSSPPLEPAAIEKIRSWIEQGAPYSGHWAYQPLQQSVPPAVQQISWPRNPIDAYILGRLEREGLSPQPEASRVALLRRVSLDLTGLPPTLEQAQEFLNDSSPDAYEKLVDRLLASPTYGEHWARMWLDLSRYADSAGYADDPPRTIWAFRDYVIRALNDNKPFDEFTIEQLAGDLLPDATDEQLIATAFHRNTLTNNEGGTNDEEFRNAAVVDRVNTTFAVWMGTTMACAQCHTHKFDPITHTDYFRLFAIFNSTADADRRDESPLLTYFTEEQKSQKQKWQVELAALKQTLATPTPELLAAYRDWREHLRPELSVTPLAVSNTSARAGSQLQISQEEILVTNAAENDTFVLRGRPAKSSSQQPWTALQLETLPPDNGSGRNFVITQVTAEIRPTGDTPAQGRFVRLELPGKQKMLSLAEVQVLAGGENQALSGVASQSSTAYDGPAELAIDGNTDGDYFQAKSTTHTAVTDNPWWEVDLQKSTPVESILVWNRTDGNTGTRLAGCKILLLDEQRQPVWEGVISDPQASQEFVPTSARQVAWKQAITDYTQSGFAAEFVLDEKDPQARGWAIAGQTDQPHQLTLLAKQPFTLQDDEELVVTIAQESPHKNHLLQRFSVRLIDDSRVLELAAIPAAMRGELSVPAENVESTEVDQELPAGPAQSLLAYYLADVAPLLKRERTEAARLETAIAKQGPYTVVPIQQELPPAQRRKTHIQLRGNFMSLGDEVQPGLPEGLFRSESAAATEPAEPTRLDLARWLMSEENPLTPRVIANRYWEKLFGIGLVATSEEFGSQGELPSHPELLDWLALELRRLDWDMKAFVRMLVLSASYRQSSVVADVVRQNDPDNRLLSRGPRFRLTAEMVRDQALFVSGLLSSKMYGPPVKPPQPTMGLSAAFGGGIDWKTSDGEDKYRRGLYTTWRRSNPYPSMAAFDAPNRETCIVRRDRTNTPLQAFVTLNDPVYVECAQALGRKAAAQPGTLREQLSWAFRSCVTREPTEREIERLAELFVSATAAYSEQPEEALKLATDPLGPLPEGAQASELAAWTLVGNVLLNLDEMLMKP